MTTAPKGSYSNFVQFSPKKRYYVMQAQRNKPFLDAEIREMSESNLDLINWLARNSFGDFAVVTNPYSNPPATSARNNAFKVEAINSIPNHLSNSNNFRILGGLNSNGYNDYPAVMYLKGFYVFLNTDIQYTEQNDDVDSHLTNVIKEYPSETIPTPSSPMSDKLSYVTRSDTYVKGGAPTLTSATTSRTDMVYVEITLDEVTYGTNSNSTSFVDPSLKDPVIGDPTANRLKASVRFLVYENWVGPTNSGIFSSTFFDDGEYTTGVKYFRAPIAIINRVAGPYINNSQCVDLLELYGKRVFSSKEVTHRLRHGGYTMNDVYGSNASLSDVDERWGATGRNQGVDTEAFNTSSVTPRVVDKEGKYKITSLAVAGSTGTYLSTDMDLGTVQPNPDLLLPGEATYKKVYSDRIALRGVTGTTLEDLRSNNDTLYVEGRTHFVGPVADKFNSNGNFNSTLTSLGGNNGVAWRPSSTIVAPTMADLRNTDLSAALSITLLGYYTPGDGGGGLFYVDLADTTPDDGGVYIASTPNGSNPGRFIRLIESRTISTYFFGATSINTPPTPTDRTAEILNAINFAQNNGMSLVIPASSLYTVSSDITFPRDVDLTIGDGTFFYYAGVTPPTVTFMGTTKINSLNPLTVHGGVKLVFAPASLTCVRPEWLFAIADSVTDNYDALNDMYEAISGTCIKALFGEASGNPDSFYLIEGPVTMSSTTEFRGPAGITVGSSGYLYVHAKIDADSTKLFNIPTISSSYGYGAYMCYGYYGYGYGYGLGYCADSYLEWGINTLPSIDVTWLGLKNDNSDGTLLLANWLKNFDCPEVNLVLYFPAGNYMLSSSLVFGSIEIIAHPMACINWY